MTAYSDPPVTVDSTWPGVAAPPGPAAPGAPLTRGGASRQDGRRPPSIRPIWLPEVWDRRAARALRWSISATPMAAVLGIATFFRFWHLSEVGYNSDEAVYAGTAASMAGHTELAGMFPVFRAHPLLFQTVLSLVYRWSLGEWSGRALAAAAGVATVAATFAVGRRLYGPTAGVVAALVLAVMPYHVIVTRQVLLDGPMTFCATMTLYCLVRYSEQPRWSWILATGGAMGATVLCKETSVILLAATYTFFALTPVIRIRLRHLLGGMVLTGLLVSAFPLVLSVSGRKSTGQNYFLWQLSRRSNHQTLFYLDTLPVAVGVLTLLAALAGLVALLGNPQSWRERLLMSWITVPVLFFTAWPLKGYQYLLPVAPAITVLAGRTVAALPLMRVLRGHDRQRLARWAVAVSALAIAGSLVTTSWSLINPSSSGTFLAGTGGVPGGREAGEWLKQNAPADSQLLSIGPSMANILQFYGGHRSYGLSVSPNPHDRNPAYLPVANPDRWVRDGEVQYVVWDSYTAARTPFFAAKITALANRYHGVKVFTASIPMRTPSGQESQNPVVIIYQVRPQ